MELLQLSSSWVTEVDEGSIHLPIRLNGWTLVDLDIWAELELAHLALLRLDVLSPHKQLLAISINSGSLRGNFPPLGCCRHRLLVIFELATWISRISSSRLRSRSLIAAVLFRPTMVRILLGTNGDDRLLVSYMHSIRGCD